MRRAIIVAAILATPAAQAANLYADPAPVLPRERGIERKIHERIPPPVLPPANGALVNMPYKEARRYLAATYGLVPLETPQRVHGAACLPGFELACATYPETRACGFAGPTCEFVLCNPTNCVQVTAYVIIGEGLLRVRNVAPFALPEAEAAKRQETARQEAARQETARQEAARQETARQETAR